MTSHNSSSIPIQHVVSPGASEPVDDLPDSETGSSSSESNSEDNDSLTDAEREWRESLQQLELLLTMVLIPFVGKYFGRKMAYMGWAKYMEWKYPVEVVGLESKSFKAAGVAEAAASL